MHLDRLEKAGMVTGQLELSEDGKAMKYFQLAPAAARRGAGRGLRGGRARAHAPLPTKKEATKCASRWVKYGLYQARGVYAPLE